MRSFIGFSIKFASFCAIHTPKFVLWSVGVFLGWLWFDVLRLRRYTVLKNITIAFPEMSKEDRYDLARLAMTYLCYAFPEFLILPRLTAKNVEDGVIFHGLEHLRAAQAQGKGVLGLGLHMGNGDIGVASVALAKHANISVISKKFKNKALNDIWFGLREAQGVKFIDPHGIRSAHEIIATTKRGGIVAFVIDQYIAAPYGIESEFFGRKTGTASGLAKFSIKLGTPVLPMYTYRDEALRTHIVFEPEVIVEPFEGETDDHLVARKTQAFNACAESIIRKHPAQWMWVHRRWKKWR